MDNYLLKAGKSCESEKTSEFISFEYLVSDI